MEGVFFPGAESPGHWGEVLSERFPMSACPGRTSLPDARHAGVPRHPPRCIPSFPRYARYSRPRLYSVEAEVNAPSSRSTVRVSGRSSRNSVMISSRSTSSTALRKWSGAHRSCSRTRRWKRGWPRSEASAGSTRIQPGERKEGILRSGSS